MRRKRICVLCLMLLVLFCLGGCQRRGTQKTTESASPGNNQTVEYQKGKDFLGVVKSVNEKGQTITFHNTAFNQDAVLVYTGGTDFLTKGGQPMSVSQLELGDTMDIYTDSTSGKLVKAQISADTFTYEGVTGAMVNPEEKYIQVGDSKYQYDDGIYVCSGENAIDVAEVNNIDQVTLRGQNGRIYSVQVTKGHGYIRPSRYKDFVGGTITVDGQTVLPVTNNMLIAVPEGAYNITMRNGDYVGTTHVTVQRDAETALDMSMAKSKPVNSGQVIFQVTPEGAEVYVNGAEVNVSKPVTLKYGKHQVSVVLEGYSTYSGVLDVESANPTVKINLAKETVDVDSAESKVTEDETNKSTTTTYDSAHKITVSTPAGAEVYANGTYKGIAPCSFTKAIGTISITLSKNGYKTKSYSVEILNDGKDITWNFSDLVKEAS